MIEYIHGDLTELTPANTEKLRKAMQNFGLI